MTVDFIIWNPDPVIFHLGNFSLRWYPVLLFAGFYISYLFLRKMFKEEGVPVKTLESFGVFILLGLFIGGRLMHCLVYEPGYYLHYPLDIIKPWRGELGNGAKFTGIRGLAGHGAAIGILLGLYINARRRHVSVLWIFDRIAIFGPLVGAFIRIGNLMNSEILGSYSNAPWAFVFARINNMPRHPAQLYEAIAYLVIFAIVYIYYKRMRERAKPGAILGLVLILVYVARFIIEFYKAPQTKVEPDMLLNFGQILSIPLLLLGLYLWFRPYSPKLKTYKSKIFEINF